MFIENQGRANFVNIDKVKRFYLSVNSEYTGDKNSFCQCTAKDDVKITCSIITYLDDSSKEEINLATYNSIQRAREVLMELMGSVRTCYLYSMPKE
jgi:hypothetical protein